MTAEALGGKLHEMCSLGFDEWKSHPQRRGVATGMSFGKFLSLMCGAFLVLSGNADSSLMSHVGRQASPTDASLQFSDRKISLPVEMNDTRSSARRTYLELKSFLGITFGESIFQTKFSELNDEFGWAFYEKGEKSFGIFDRACAFADANGKVYKVCAHYGDGKHTSTEAKNLTKQIMAHVSKIIALEYGQYGMEMVIRDSNGDRWSSIMKKRYGDEWSSLMKAKEFNEFLSSHSFYCFRNSKGRISQVITLFGDNDIGITAEVVAGTGQDFSFLKAPMFGQKPELKSFCGIFFGAVLEGDVERTPDGKYLTGYVTLKTPFRGVDTAQVYAGVRSRQIFRIVIETNDVRSDIKEILNKKYNPNNNPMILDSSNDTIRLRDSFIQIKGKCVGTGEFYLAKETGNSYNIICDGDPVWLVQKEKTHWIAVMDAQHMTYKSQADREYEDESGGDGSSVL